MRNLFKSCVIAMRILPNNSRISLVRNNDHLGGRRARDFGEEAVLKVVFGIHEIAELIEKGLLPLDDLLPQGIVFGQNIAIFLLQTLDLFEEHFQAMLVVVNRDAGHGVEVLAFIPFL